MAVLTDIISYENPHKTAVSPHYYGILFPDSIRKPYKFDTINALKTRIIPRFFVGGVYYV